VPQTKFMPNDLYITLTTKLHSMWAESVENALM